MKHIVRLCRPRFEVAVLEVEAEDDDAATLLAEEQAEELPGSAWHLQPHDEAAYHSHVESCHSDRTIDANVGDDPKEREAYVEELKSGGDETRDMRYLLLLADVGTGEGRVIFEPWFSADEPELLEADLTGDWSDALDAVTDEGLENFEAFAQEQTNTVDLPPEEAYAFRKTGLLAVGGDKRQWPRHLVEAWDAAVAEYRSIQAAKDRPGRPDPRVWNTEIPELLISSFSQKDLDQVIECTEAISPIEARGIKVATRIELAAALVASACEHAYQAGVESGEPNGGPELFTHTEEVILRRAREIYSQGHH